MASAFPGLPVRRGLRAGLPASQTRPAPEASSVRSGLLQCMKILSETLMEGACEARGAAIATGIFFLARCTISGLSHGLPPPWEGRMSKFAIRLLMLTISAMALVLVPTVAPANAETSSGRHIKKHKRQMSPGFIAPRSAGQPWPVSRPSSQPGAACPGIARGIDCRVWPPPFDDDPDRKISGSDGG
jgi:hypothetical protein